MIRDVCYVYHYDHFTLMISKYDNNFNNDYWIALYSYYPTVRSWLIRCWFRLIKQTIFLQITNHGIISSSSSSQSSHQVHHMQTRADSILCVCGKMLCMHCIHAQWMYLKWLRWHVFGFLPASQVGPPTYQLVAAGRFMSVWLFDNLCNINGQGPCTVRTPNPFASLQCTVVNENNPYSI